jgi:hypothetical protein
MEFTGQALQLRLIVRASRPARLNRSPTLPGRLAIVWKTC